jgi:hypothetical protein
LKDSPGCSKVPCTAEDGTGAEQSDADALQIKNTLGTGLKTLPIEKHNSIFKLLCVTLNNEMVYNYYDTTNYSVDGLQLLYFQSTAT